VFVWPPGSILWPAAGVLLILGFTSYQTILLCSFPVLSPQLWNYSCSAYTGDSWSQLILPPLRGLLAQQPSLKFLSWACWVRAAFCLLSSVYCVLYLLVNSSTMGQLCSVPGAAWCPPCAAQHGCAWLCVIYVGGLVAERTSGAQKALAEWEERGRGSVRRPACNSHEASQMSSRWCCWW
jgi:hypothetical protein